MKALALLTRIVYIYNFKQVSNKINISEIDQITDGRCSVIQMIKFGTHLLLLEAENPLRNFSFN